jgi:hypothetical protein
MLIINITFDWDIKVSTTVLSLLTVAMNPDCNLKTPGKYDLHINPVYFIAM